MLGGWWLGQDFGPRASNYFVLHFTLNSLSNPPPSTFHIPLDPLGQVLYIDVCSSWFQQTRLFTRRLIYQSAESSTLNVQTPDFRDPPTSLEHNNFRRFVVVTNLPLYGSTSAGQQWPARHRQ